MPSGIDPIHRHILAQLKREPIPITAREIHGFGNLGILPSIEGIGRRLRTMKKRGWVENEMPPYWVITDAGCAVLASM